VFKKSETLQQVKSERMQFLAHGTPMMMEAARRAAQNRAQPTAEL
jgi:hypothetical protein